MKNKERWVITQMLRSLIPFNGVYVMQDGIVVTNAVPTDIYYKLPFGNHPNILVSAGTPAREVWEIYCLRGPYKMGIPVEVNFYVTYSSKYDEWVKAME